MDSGKTIAFWTTTKPFPLAGETLDAACATSLRVGTTIPSGTPGKLRGCDGSDDPSIVIVGHSQGAIERIVICELSSTYCITQTFQNRICWSKGNS